MGATWGGWVEFFKTKKVTGERYSHERAIWGYYNSRKKGETHHVKKKGVGWVETKIGRVGLRHTSVGEKIEKREHCGEAIQGGGRCYQGSQTTMERKNNYAHDTLGDVVVCSCKRTGKKKKEKKRKTVTRTRGAWKKKNAPPSFEGRHQVEVKSKGERHHEKTARMPRGWRTAPNVVAGKTGEKKLKTKKKKKHV